MEFKDKIDFLLRLTMTTNRQLASALMVDPSFISRLRQGKRALPQKATYSNDIGAFFAKKITTDFQRNALLEAINKNENKSINNASSIALAISDWLLEKKETNTQNISQFIHDVNEKELSYIGESKNTTKPINTQSHAYYGNEGKRSAVRDFFTYLTSMSKPCTILVSSDEDLNWLNEKESFIEELQNCLLILANKGYSFCRIYSRIYTSDDPVDAISRWLPLYMYGNVKTYYYPRNRDNLYKRTLIVAPGIAAVCSSSIGSRPESDLTFLNIDQGMANAAAREFNDYLSKCIPMCNIYRNENEGYTIQNCLLKYVKTQGNRINKYSSLPSYIAPQSLLKHVFKFNRKNIDTFAYLSFINEDNLSRFEQTDIISLPSIEDIINGKVLCSISRLVVNPIDIYYTVPVFIDHLKSILYLLNKYPNYNVFILNDETNKNIVCTIENTLCYIIRPNNPFTIFEISESNFISSVNDYLLNVTNESCYRNPAERKRTISTISELIEKLETAL